MADRQVKATGKNEDGDITSLCNDGADWSPRASADAIRDIDNNVHTYHVGSGSSRVDIHVVDGDNGRFLRTDPDRTTTNNLDELPNC